MTDSKTPDEPELVDGPDPDGETDDALSWEGDDTLQRATSLDERAHEPEGDAPPRRGMFDVVREMTTGDKVVAAIFMLLSVASAAGWIAVVVANPVTLPGTVLMLMYELGEFLAIIAAPLAAFTVIQLTRGRTRVIWLAAMLVVTLPWPLLGVLL